MRIEIAGREYQFEVHGTIGLMYKAELLLGTEEFDANNKHHQVALLYAAFQSSNRRQENLPTLDDFMCSLTTKKYNDLLSYFWQRWSELEPQPSEDGGQKQGEG